MQRSAELPLQRMLWLLQMIVVLYQLGDPHA